MDGFFHQFGLEKMSWCLSWVRVEEWSAGVSHVDLQGSFWMYWLVQLMTEGLQSVAAEADFNQNELNTLLSLFSDALFCFFWTPAAQRPLLLSEEIKGRGHTSESKGVTYCWIFRTKQDCRALLHGWDGFSYVSFKPSPPSYCKNTLKCIDDALML